MNVALTVIKYHETYTSPLLGHMINIQGNYNLSPKPVHTQYIHFSLQAVTLLYQAAYSEASHLNTGPGNPSR